MCPACSTPHHRDCFEYFGGCAIFGCRDGSTPSKTEIATWPSAIRWVNCVGYLRRLQAPFLIIAALGPAITVGTTLVPGSSPSFRLDDVGMLMLFGGGGVYLLADVVVTELWRIAGVILGKPKKDDIVPSAQRLASIVPVLGSDRGLQLVLGYTGIGIALLGIVKYGFDAPLSLLPAFYVAFMLILVPRQLRLHEDQVRLAINRLTASVDSAGVKKVTLPHDR